MQTSNANTSTLTRDEFIRAHAWLSGFDRDRCAGYLFVACGYCRFATRDECRAMVDAAMAA